MMLETNTSCGWKPDWMYAQSAKEVVEEPFFRNKKRELDHSFHKLGLHVRSVYSSDYESLMGFISQHFYGYVNLTPPRMYQIISFGESILLLNKRNQIKGYILEVSYLRDRVSHGASMAIDSDLAGAGLGRQLFSYSSLLAMNSGALMKKGMISPDNFPSIKSIVNGSGAAIVGFRENLFGMGPKLIFNLPLVPKILDRGELNFRMLSKQVEEGALSKIAAIDLVEIRKRLSKGEVIVALLDKHFVTCPSSFFYPAYLQDNQRKDG